MIEKFNAVSYQKQLSDSLEFTVKEEHLKLLKNMYVDWDNAENGAPEIDPKRPYGDSDLIESIGRVLGIKPIQTEDEENFYPADQALEFRKLHLETQLVLEICLRVGSFKVGKFKRESRYQHNWK